MTIVNHCEKYLFCEDCRCVTKHTIGYSKNGENVDTHREHYKCTDCGVKTDDSEEASIEFEQQLISLVKENKFAIEKGRFFALLVIVNLIIREEKRREKENTKQGWGASQKHKNRFINTSRLAA